MDSAAIDVREAYAALQEFHGGEMSRLAGDIAAKNTYIAQLERENKALMERITALEQNQQSNGAKPSGADLSHYPLPVPNGPPPGRPKVIRSLENQQP